ncbi:hypothetical protein EVA_13596, partial [gut metagenome]
MANQLKDRKEKTLYKGSVYELTLSGTEKVSASAFAVCLLSMRIF